MGDGVIITRVTSHSSQSTSQRAPYITSSNLSEGAEISQHSEKIVNDIFTNPLKYVNILQPRILQMIFTSQLGPAVGPCVELAVRAVMCDLWCVMCDV